MIIQWFTNLKLNRCVSFLTGFFLTRFQVLIFARYLIATYIYIYIFDCISVRFFLFFGVNIAIFVFIQLSACDIHGHFSQAILCSCSVVLVISSFVFSIVNMCSVIVNGLVNYLEVALASLSCWKKK